jgi:hypothetical protein
MLQQLRDRLESIIHRGCLDGSLRNNAYASLGYVNALIAYNVKATQEDVDGIASEIEALEDVLC